MFRNIVISAFGAGLAVCVVVTALQFATTEPLILHAEEFEGGSVVANWRAVTTTHTASPAPKALMTMFLNMIDPGRQ